MAENTERDENTLEEKEDEPDEKLKAQGASAAVARGTGGRFLPSRLTRMAYCHLLPRSWINYPLQYHA